jgi:hypothetical protein
LAFDDEATALQYAQDCGVGEVVEYVPAKGVSGMSLIEREKALDAERVRRQDAAGWTRGAHIPGTRIDWRVEALALEAQLAGAVEDRDRLRALLKQAHDRDKWQGEMPPIKWYDDVARYFRGQ